MPHASIPWDLTLALAIVDIKETEETAQVKSKTSNEGIIATDADSFILNVLNAH